MTRTTRKHIMKSRLNAMLNRKEYARLHGEQSAVALLRNEAQRLQSLPPCGNKEYRAKLEMFIYSLEYSAIWLAARNSPDWVQRWQEIPNTKKP